MNLFDTLVVEALKNQPEYYVLRNVVEKELLHHDILRILSQNNLLTDLTFIGGTALRSCYGAVRLSEDLDFTGGVNFSRDSLASLGQVIVKNIHQKYGLKVVVSEPIKDTQNVDTWKIKIETKPKQKHLPAQRINVDICALPSYERKPMLLLNPYGVEMGTNGLIIQTQSKGEIYTDKLLAFALRANRVKYRDLWDIAWLHQQKIKPNFDLLDYKLKDRQISKDYFLQLFIERKNLISSNKVMAVEFKKEMLRFLPMKNIDFEQLWLSIVYLIDDLLGYILRSN